MQKLSRSMMGISFVLIAAVLIAACSSGDPEAPGESPGQASADGAALYATSCASCHGTDLGGTEKGPSHLSIVYEPNHHPDDAFRSAIANGAPEHHWDFGAMPAVQGLSDGEVEAVIAFVRAEQERVGFEG